MAIDYDEGRVVALDKSSAMMGHDEGRVAYDQGRVMAELAFFDPLALAYDQGRVVHDPINTHYLGHGARVTWDSGRPVVDGSFTQPPVIPLGPDILGTMLGELQANRVQAQRFGLNIHKI